MPKQHLKLTAEHEKHLTDFLNRGHVRARVTRRATALLQLNQGASLVETGRILGVDYYTIALWRDKYLANGLEFLNDLPRAGRPLKFDGEERAAITALACSDVPSGRAKWSLKLLADKAIELELVGGISPSKVRDILKKTNFNRT